MAATIPSCLQEMGWAPAPCRPRTRRQTLRREDSRQTNPIWPSRQAGRVARERKRAKRTQFGPGIQTPAGPNVRNEPNCSIADCGLRIGDTSAAERLPCRLVLSGCAARLCKTNPIWPGLGRARSPAGERCKTNPISPVGQGPRGQNVQNEPNFVHSGTCCPESIGGGRAGTPNLPRAELCETNPISPERPGMGAGGWGRDAPRTNYAKRTQFLNCGLRIEDGLPAGLPIMRNEPNLAAPRHDGATDCLFLSSRVASILGGHSEPKNRDGKG